jgi:[protein-PII] uridylyltransferase
MALAGANIVGAQIFTMTNGMALDSFTIQEAPALDGAAPAAFAEPARLARLSTLVEQALSGRIRLAEQIARRRQSFGRTRVFDVPPRVFVDNDASVMHTVIEVNGRDRLGFLFDVTRAITALGLQISTAKIMTWGERVVDVFYVKDVFGHKVLSDAKLRQVRERLLAACADPDAATEAPRQVRASVGAGT